MREITDHKLNGLNNALKINVLDEPGHGGACHSYSILFLAGTPDIPEDKRMEMQLVIDFQKGPVQEHGVNGISGESLIAIEIDRLRSFQSGPFQCRENAIALTHLENALMWLQKRTRDRMARGVEGTSAK